MYSTPYNNPHKQYPDALEMVFISIFVFLTFVSEINSFTKDYRALAISFHRSNGDNEITVEFDIATSSIAKTAMKTCQMYGCIPNDSSEVVRLVSEVMETR